MFYFFFLLTFVDPPETHEMNSFFTVSPCLLNWFFFFVEIEEKAKDLDSTCSCSIETPLPPNPSFLGIKIYIYFFYTFFIEFSQEYWQNSTSGPKHSNTHSGPFSPVLVLKHEICQLFHDENVMNIFQSLFLMCNFCIQPISFNSSLNLLRVQMVRLEIFCHHSTLSVPKMHHRIK